MSHPIFHGDERRDSSTHRNYAFWTFALSLAAIIATFLMSVYVPDVDTKGRGFSAIVIVFLIGCAALYLRHSGSPQTPPADRGDREDDIDTRLQILDEARQFFAGSLKVSDTFRLVVSRMSGMLAVKSVTLLLLDPSRESFLIAESDDPAAVKGKRFSLTGGIVGRCYAERDVIVDDVLSSAAIPLRKDAEVFGILLFELAEGAAVRDLPVLLDAIGERVSPLILASMAFERSQDNALTDVTTELPNERAFHLVLENQVAEAIRRGNSRPLTILSFDIKDFEGSNRRFGFGAGERILNFVAQSAKDSLRQMDFLARGTNDEFLAIMPTASKEISHEIIARIQASVFHRRIKVSEVDTTEVELTFGWASFGSDGETPRDLLAAARERREQSKSGVPGSVVWFPQELAN